MNRSQIWLVAPPEHPSPLATTLLLNNIAVHVVHVEHLLTPMNRWPDIQVLSFRSPGWVAAKCERLVIASCDILKLKWHILWIIVIGTYFVNSVRSIKGLHSS